MGVEHWVATRPCTSFAHGIKCMFYGAAALRLKKQGNDNSSGRCSGVMQTYPNGRRNPPQLHASSFGPYRLYDTVRLTNCIKDPTVAYPTHVIAWHVQPDL